MKNSSNSSSCDNEPDQIGVCLNRKLKVNTYTVFPDRLLAQWKELWSWCTSQVSFQAFNKSTFSLRFSGPQMLTKCRNFDL